jgi:prephenate dehydratase
MRLLYLGPPGSFTHAAVGSLDGDVDAVPGSDVRSIIAAVEDGTEDHGLVPLENSVEGDVASTLDELLFATTRCLIRREVVVPVTFVLCGPPGATLDGVTEVLSHPHALAQCKDVLARLGAQTRLTTSTSQACADVAAAGRPELAALCARQAADAYSLTVLAEGVEDRAGAATRMALVGRELAEPTGRDVTLVALTPSGNRTGILAEMLRCFSDREVALSRISSRPLKGALGVYCFVVAAQGHLADEPVAAALDELASLEVSIKLLGCYPEADAHATAPGSAPPGSCPPADWPDRRASLLRGAR